MVGRPRPDMFSRCWPDKVLEILDQPHSQTERLLFFNNLPSDPFAYECDPNKRNMYSAFKSFPSGHSGYSAAGCGFIALYLIGKFHLFSSSSSTLKKLMPIIQINSNQLNSTEFSESSSPENLQTCVSQLVKSLFNLNSFKFTFGILPFILCSIYIGITRVQDYRHHIEDVMVGLILGWAVSWIIYRLYYTKGGVSLRQKKICQETSVA